MFFLWRSGFDWKQEDSAAFCRFTNRSLFRRCVFWKVVTVMKKLGSKKTYFYRNIFDGLHVKGLDTNTEGERYAQALRPVSLSICFLVICFLVFNWYAVQTSTLASTLTHTTATPSPFLPVAPVTTLTGTSTDLSIIPTPDAPSPPKSSLHSGSIVGCVAGAIIGSL